MPQPPSRRLPRARHRRQIVAHLRGVWYRPLRFLLEGLGDDAPRAQRHVRVQLDRRSGFAVQNGVEHDGRRAALKVSDSGHLVQNDAEREQIASARPVPLPALAPATCRRSSPSSRLARREEFGRLAASRGAATDRQSAWPIEVEDLWPGRDPSRNIRGLDVAMQDAAGGARRPGHRQSVRPTDTSSPPRARPSIDSAVERPSFEQRHRQEGAALELVYLVDRADVRVVQRGRRACLAEKKALGRGAIVGAVWAGKNFSATRRPSLTSSAL